MAPKRGPSASKKLGQGCAARAAFYVDSWVVWFADRHKRIRLAEDHWSELQFRVATVIRNPVVEFLVGFFVVVSFVLMVLETDSAPKVPDWVVTVNGALLATYTLEMALRLFVFRTAFFYSFFNIFEFVIIVLDLLSVLSNLVFAGNNNMPSLAPLRVCRTLRLVRGFKLAVRFPQLTLIVKGLVRGLSASFWGTGLLLVIMTIWAVLAVQFIHPVNERVALSGAYDGCHRCPGAFASVRNAMITFVQQIIAGDSWGMVTIPVIEEAPETAIFFGLVFISVNVTLMNVILAVIVDVALKASEEEKEAEKFDKAKKELLTLCRRIDADKSGDLTEEEVTGCFDNNEDFRDLLLSLDIKKENIHVVFGIMDVDGSGTVNYQEFISELLDMKRTDSHGMLLFLKHYITDIRRDIHMQVRNIRTELRHSIRDLAEGADLSVRCINTDTTLQGSEAEAYASAVSDENAESARREGSGSPRPSPGRRARGLRTWHGGDVRDVNMKDVCMLEKLSREPFSLKELGDELRDLRKVISDELMQSIKEISKPTTVPFPLAGFDPPQTLRLPPEFLVAAGSPQERVGHPPGAPVAEKQKLPPAPAKPPPPGSSWALQRCCVAQSREVAAVVLQDLKRPPPGM